MNIPGIASGLDTSGIIEKLMNIEKQPYDRMQKDLDNLELKKNMVQEANTKVLDFQSDVFDMGLEKSFKTQNITSSNSSVVNATIDGVPSNNSSYNIVVTKLAQAHTISSDQQTQVTENDESLGFSGGQFSINGVQFTMDNGYTLEDFADQINNNKDAGVDAEIVDRTLVIKSSDTGAASTITLSDDTGTVLKDLGVLDAGDAIKNEIKIAQDADYSVNGLALTSSTNELDNVLGGIKMTLDGVGSSTVKITNDVDSTVDKIKSFVDKYNELINYLADKTSEDPAKQEAIDAAYDYDNKKKLQEQGLLKNDYTLESLQDSVREVMSRSVGDINMDMIGISSKGMQGGSMSQDARRGILEVDEEKLRNALESDPDKVMTLFRNPGSKNDVSDESVGTGSGFDTTFYLDNENIGEDITVKVGGTELKEVTSNPIAGEYMIDHNTGQITFGNAPLAGDEIKADYTYMEGKQFSSEPSHLVSKGSGYNKTYFLGAKNIKDGVNVEVDGTTYKEVASIDDLSANDEYYLDHDSGKVTFFQAPANGVEIRSTYDYTISDEGLMYPLDDALKAVSGIGSLHIDETQLDTQIKDTQERLTQMKSRLDDKEASLWKKWNALESSMGSLQSQSSWLSGQLAKLG